MDIGVAAQVQIAGVAFPGREEEADLRAESDRSALVVAELGASATVAADLLIDIADQAGVNALADELRGCPIGMEVDPVAVIQRSVGATEAEARHHGKLLAGLRVEIGVAGA